MGDKARSTSSKIREDIFTPAHPACIFLVDRDFITKDVVKKLYGCKNPATPGGIIQVVRGLTVPEKYGPNLLTVHQTSLEGDMVTGVTTTLAPYAYVFYGENYLVHEDVNLDARELCHNSAESARESKHVWKEVVSVDRDTVLVNFLLDEVFKLSTKSEKSRAVLYVTCSMNVLADLYEGNLAICKRVQNVQLAEHPVADGDDGSVLAPRMCPLFLPIAVTPLPRVLTMGTVADRLKESEVADDRRRLLEDVYGRPSLTRFHHTSVSENVRTANLLSAAILCGLDADDGIVVAKKMFCESHDDDKRDTICSSVLDKFQKCTNNKSIRVPVKQIPTDELLGPAIGQSTLRVYAEAQKIAEYAGDAFTSQGFHFDVDNVNASLAAWYIPLVASPLSVLNKVKVVVPEDAGESKGAPPLNAVRWQLDSCMKNKPISQIFARSCGYNPHLTYRFLYDLTKYYGNQRKLVKSLLEDPCIEQFPKKIHKNVVAARMYNSTMYGSQCGPLGTSDYTYVDADEHREMQQQMQKTVIKTLLSKVKNSNNSFNFVFGGDEKTSPSSKLDPNQLVSDLLALLREADESAIGTMKCILRKGEDSPMSYKKPRVDATYNLQCNMDQSNSHFLGPIGYHVVNASSVYTWKALVATKICNEVFGSSTLSVEAFVSQKLPGLETLVMSQYLDTKWSLTLEHAQTTHDYTLPRADENSVKDCAGVSVPDGTMRHKSLTLKSKIVDYYGEIQRKNREFESNSTKFKVQKMTSLADVSDSLMSDLLPDGCEDMSFDDVIKLSETVLMTRSYATYFVNTVARASGQGDRREFFSNLKPNNAYVMAYLMCLLDEFDKILCAYDQPRSVGSFVSVLYQLLLVRKINRDPICTNIRDIYMPLVPILAQSQSGLTGGRQDGGGCPTKSVLAKCVAPDNPVTLVMESGPIVCGEYFNYYTSGMGTFVSNKIDTGMSVDYVRRINPRLFTTNQMKARSHLLMYMLKVHGTLLPPVVSNQEGSTRTLENILMEEIRSMFTEREVVQCLIKGGYDRDVFTETNEDTDIIESICDIAQASDMFANWDVDDLWRRLVSHVSSLTEEGPPCKKQKTC